MKDYLGHLSRFALAAFLGVLTLFTFNLSNTHRITPYDVDEHQPAFWLSTTDLVGDGNTYYVRTTDSNHVVYDQNNQIVAIGEPEERPLGRSEHTFVSNFTTVEGYYYDIDINGEVYSQQPQTVQLYEEPPLLPQVLLFLFSLICFVIFTIRFIAFFF